MPKMCATEGCHNELTERSKLDVCSSCRSSFYYWKKRSPAEILGRRAQLRKFKSRLDRDFPSVKAVVRKVRP